jgi:hypothetical protein
MLKPSLPSTTHFVALAGWETRRGGKISSPSLYPEKVVEHYGRSGEKMISAGFFSGLATQSEIDDLLDMLYGSYGERLIVSYKEAS